MPVLKNPRRELFCQLVIKNLSNGGNYTDAYRKAGYAGDQRTLEVGASRLMSFDDIQARIAELTAPAVRKARLTADTLMQKFERIETGAYEAGQFGPAGKAAELQGKLSGLMIERVEHGAPGEFDACQDIATVAARMLDEGDLDQHLASLDLLRSELLRAASGRATKVVDAPDVIRPLPGAETQLALRALRPSRANGRHR